jgi:isoquinoline 1-oxidoreductase beta subunit
VRRRRLLLSATAAGGALLVGWGLLPPRGRLGSAASWPTPDEGGNVALNGWIKVTPEGDLLLAMNRSEMGQGVHTALAMLVAEELDLPLPRVRLVEAGHDTIYGNVAMFVGSLPIHPANSQPGRETEAVRSGRWLVSKLARELGINATGGSSSIADGFTPLREAAATARGQLLGAASLRWKLPVEELEVVEGVVRHEASGSSAHYGELVRAAAMTRPAFVAPKPASQWKLIGQPAPRTDVMAKSSGRAGFGIDVRRPGQRFAVLRHAPALGGGLGPVDVDALRRQPGVLRVVRLGPVAGSTAAVAVVARTSWHAMRALQAVPPVFTPRAAGPLDSQVILAALEAEATRAAQQGGGFGFHSTGDVAGALAHAPRRLQAVYRAPYLAHAPLEPVNCTVQVTEGRVEVWAPTQVPGMARNLAAQVAGVPVDAVTVHVSYLGGGFGRRLDVDFVGQAVRVAMEMPGVPVQLLWPREEDLTHDFYRPAAVAVLQAALDAQGRLDGLAITSAGDAVTPRWLERGLPALSGPMDAPDKSTSEGLFDLPYAVPHQRIGHVATRHEVPVGYWRSVGHSHNAFFSESFIDEVAHALGQDPVAFRLSLLKGMPRHAAVLKLAAQQAGWGRPLPAGRARGVALHESFDTIVAQVAEVSLEAGRPRVHRVVAAVDCGIVVNPQIVAQQMEGGVIFGLSAALFGRIDIEGGVVRQKNFPDYPLVTMKDAPVVQTHIVPSERHPSGMGEPGVPPIAPAVANALFVLTGRRLRELPLRV